MNAANVPNPRLLKLATMLRYMAALTLLAGVWLATTVAPSAAQADAQAIVPGELRVDATLDHLGAVWFVDGDVDLDSTMTLDYRRLGESTWRSGALAIRAEPTVTVDGSPLGIDSWAASAMFLERGTRYELRATLTDPDGGNATRVVEGATRTAPQPGTNTRFVAPGSGGGSGSQNNPYLGLQAAADNAAPGDTFRVAAGTYNPFILTTSGTAGAPISFVGPADGAAVIDGAGTDRGVVTIGQFSAGIEHVIVSGLTIRNGRWGIDAQRTANLMVTNNVITDVDYGIVNRRDNGDERFQIVCDNVVRGRTPWPGTGIPSERGIDLRGWGHTVCNNEVSDFGDCVSVQPLSGPSFGNDVFGNDAYRCVDDGIEVDYNQANVRVYRNRVTNARMGVSVQPIYGGPAYIFRNELFNLESNTFKLNNGPSGLVLAHNTGVKLGDGLSDGSVFNNAVVRNNLILGTRYAFEFTTTTTEGFRDFDFGAWGTSRTEGPWFKWDNVRYDRIADLPPGVEDNGIEAGFDAVRSAPLPTSWDVEVAVGAPDLRPTTGSPVIDRGAVLANLNDPFVTDGAPDAGAFEIGATPTRYGPGTPLIVAPNSNTSAGDDILTATVGSTVSFDICANDTVATPPGRITRISGWYGPGLSRSGCIISGTPTRVGSFAYRYLLTDANGVTDTARVSITITVDAADLAPVANDDFISGRVGTFVSFDICANDEPGNGPLQPRRVSGSYGPGLARTNWCIVSGTPTAAGTYNYRYRLTDNDGDTDTASVTITIAA